MCIIKKKSMRQNSVKELLQKAIINLLCKKPFIDITVTDLVKEAGVARASFYRVYKNADDVVDDVASKMNDNYRKNVFPAIKAKDEKKIKQIIYNFFVSVKEPQNPYTHLLPDNFSMIISKIYQKNPDNINISDDPMVNKYVSGMLFIGISSVAKIWTKNGFVESVEDMVDFSYETFCKKLLFQSK